MLQYKFCSVSHTLTPCQSDTKPTQKLCYFLLPTLSRACFFTNSTENWRQTRSETSDCVWNLFSSTQAEASPDSNRMPTISEYQYVTDTQLRMRVHEYLFFYKINQHF